jgi:hypothetical protein
VKSGPPNCVVPLLELVIGTKSVVPKTISLSPNIKAVEPVSPEKYDTTLVYVATVPLVDGFGPDVSALKSTPKTVVPDKGVIVFGYCFTCLPLE